MSSFDLLQPNLKIEGFDPNSVLTKIIKTNDAGEVLEESLFMKYAPAMAWFLTVYPNGGLNHVFVERTNQRAIVTASIYRDINDARPAITATATRYYSDSENGRYYEQNAVTAAYRKALGYLGFGTPLDAHEVEGIETIYNAELPEQTDSGVILKSVKPSIPTNLVNTEEEKPAPRKRTVKSKTEKPEENTSPADTTEVKEASAAEPVTEEPAQAENPVSKAEPSVPAAQKTVAPIPKKEQPSVPVKKPTTLEEVKAFKFPMGMYRDKTFEEVAQEKNPDFFRWYCDRERKNNPNAPFTEALQLYCEYIGV